MTLDPHVHLLSSSLLVQTALQTQLKSAALSAHTRLEQLIAAASGSGPGVILLDYYQFGRPAAELLRSVQETRELSSFPVWLLHPPGFEGEAALLETEFPQVRKLIRKPFKVVELEQWLAAEVARPVAFQSKETILEIELSPMPEPSPELPPGVTAHFAWSAQRGLTHASTEAARMAGLAAPFCLQIARGVADGLGLGALAQVHLFSPQDNLSLIAGREDVTGLLTPAHVSAVDVAARFRNQA